MARLDPRWIPRTKTGEAIEFKFRVYPESSWVSDFQTVLSGSDFMSPLVHRMSLDIFSACINAN